MANKPKGKKGKGPRVIIHLECQTCRKSDQPGVSRYSKTKNKKTMPDRLSLSKYCRFERKHTPHKEIK
ncbi:MAG: 50S ribosomal protein L33 [Bdellovibrionales bacterium]|nr:50S ribosomal protein L33 [Bdellovibrionales bacterium]MBT3524888.1 50S ribosomal protein L33 [Bdellovibrionales bacterium]MBT7669301.1 50S ribosomal protein L33 [Bdellovibrionales bacterium]MBT7768242.1 50S ribosomal protein L33 [Bdellovibrionales bacterium]